MGVVTTCRGNPSWRRTTPHTEGADVYIGLGTLILIIILLILIF
jgi:hypothetical protein